MLGELFFVFVFRILIIGESPGLGDLMERETRRMGGYWKQKDICGMSLLDLDSD